jgi:hypothetical protein
LHGHEVEDDPGRAVAPSADDAALDVAHESAGGGVPLDAMELRQPRLNDGVDIERGAHGVGERIRHQQPGDSAAHEDHLFPQFSECLRDQAQLRQVRIIRPHRPPPAPS